MLAPKQEVLKQLEAASTGGGPHRIVDDSPITIISFRNLLKKVVWDANKFALDICELVSKDEREWKVSRKLLMDRFMESERAYMNLVQVMLSKETKPEETPEEKDGKV